MYKLDFESKELCHFDFKEIKEFIDCWEKFYNRKKYDPKTYFTNLKITDSGYEKLTEDNISILLKWKDKQHFSKDKIKKIIDKINDINNFRFGKITEQEFPTFFPKGDGIWDVFIKHIAKPIEFPLYDQHVFRSYRFHNCVGKNEIKESYPDYKNYFSSIYKSYYDKEKFEANIQTVKNMKKIDNALMAYGKFLKFAENYLNFMRG